MLFAHLLLFLLYDEDTAPTLTEALSIVELSDELMVYEEATCLITGVEQQVESE